MLVFGEKPKCEVCGVEIRRDNVSLYTIKKCKWCHPQPMKQNIGPYSGPSARFRGGYEKDYDDE